jgi:putative transcriptional regulator
MLRFKLAERIADKEFRERRRITALEIAEATGINRMTLSKLMNKHGANVQTDSLDRLCAYFGCGIEDLVEYFPDGPSQDARPDAT